MDQAHEFAGIGPPRAAAHPEDWRRNEAHHRIANDLAVIASMVRLQAQSLPDQQPLSPEQARDLLEGAAGRIDAVGRLHRTLSYAGERKGASDFLKGLCKDSASLAASVGAVVSCRVELKQEIDSERLRSIGLILHEMVLNALKHAHPSGVPVRVDIWCRDEPNGDLAIDVGDDGVGLPEGFDPLRGGGFGFRVIRALAKQVNAEVAFDSSDLGLVCRIRARLRSSLHAV